MAPLIAQLVASGVSLLGNALLNKGKDYVEEKLGTTLPDLGKQVSPEQLAELRALEFKHEELLQQLAIRKAELDLEGERVAQGAVNERWKADMLSDSKLSKNIRPLVLIYLLLTYSILSSASAFGLHVTQAYVELLAQMLMLVMGAYFAGRSIEKIVDMRERGKTE
jgi:hypothetical protein